MFSKEKVQTECVVCRVSLWRMRTVLKNAKNGPFCSNKCAGVANRKPVEIRFRASWDLNEDTLCWDWNRRLNTDGYGFILNDDRKQIGAHRASWMIHRGPIPQGMHVLHRCDRPCCVNPNHLFLGTHTDNMQDMYRKGRGGARGCPGDRHYQGKLNSHAVRLIWTEHARGRQQKDIALELGVSHSTINDVIKGRTWRSVEVKS